MPWTPHPDKNEKLEVDTGFIAFGLMKFDPVKAGLLISPFILSKDPDSPMLICTSLSSSDEFLSDKMRADFLSSSEGSEELEPIICYIYSLLFAFQVVI